MTVPRSVVIESRPDIYYWRIGERGESRNGEGGVLNICFLSLSNTILH